MSQRLGMAMEEPMFHPFPTSDYGTGITDAIAASMGVSKGTTVGASWWGGCSQVVYDTFLFRLRTYPSAVWYLVPIPSKAAWFTRISENI